MSTLHDTSACAEHQEKSDDASPDWCAVRVAGAELGQWNGDYIVKEFDSTYE